MPGTQDGEALGGNGGGGWKGGGESGTGRMSTSSLRWEAMEGRGWGTLHLTFCTPSPQPRLRGELTGWLGKPQAWPHSPRTLSPVLPSAGLAHAVPCSSRPNQQLRSPWAPCWCFAAQWDRAFTVAGCSGAHSSSPANQTARSTLDADGAMGRHGHQGLRLLVVMVDPMIPQLTNHGNPWTLPVNNVSLNMCSGG